MQDDSKFVVITQDIRTHRYTEVYGPMQMRSALARWERMTTEDIYHPRTGSRRLYCLPVESPRARAALRTLRGYRFDAA